MDQNVLQYVLHFTFYVFRFKLTLFRSIVKWPCRRRSIYVYHFEKSEHNREQRPMHCIHGWIRERVQGPHKAGLRRQTLITLTPSSTTRDRATRPTRHNRTRQFHMAMPPTNTMHSIVSFCQFTVIAPSDCVSQCETLGTNKHTCKRNRQRAKE